MKNYIVYNTQGEILRTGYCPDEMVDIQAQVGELVIEGIANDVTQYMLNDTTTDKSVMSLSTDKITITANGIDASITTGLPNPSYIYINGIRQAIVIIDGVLEFTVNTPGIYKIRIESFPYLDYEFEVTAT